MDAINNGFPELATEQPDVPARHLMDYTYLYPAGHTSRGLIEEIGSAEARIAELEAQLRQEREELEAQVAQLQATISQLREERDHNADMLLAKQKDWYQQAATISTLTRERDEAIAAARVMSGKIDAYCAGDELLQATISQLREHIANLLGLTQAPLENITDYTVFGDASPRGIRMTQTEAPKIPARWQKTYERWEGGRFAIEEIAFLEAALTAIKKSDNWLSAWTIADEAIKKVEGDQ